VTVVCKVDYCPYKSINGFCKNRVLSITKDGRCGHIYDKNGCVKSDWQDKID